MSNATANVKSAVKVVATLAIVPGTAILASGPVYANGVNVHNQGNTGNQSNPTQHNPAVNDRSTCSTAVTASDFVNTPTQIQGQANPPDTEVVDPALAAGQTTCNTNRAEAQAAAEQYLQNQNELGQEVTASQVSEHLQSQNFDPSVANDVANNLDISNSGNSQIGNTGNGNGANVNTGNNRTSVRSTVFNPAALPTSIPGQFGTRFSVQSQTAAAQIACDGTVVLSGVNIAGQVGDVAGQVQWQTPVTRGGDQTACENLPVESAFTSVINTIAPAVPAQAQSQAELQRQGQAVIINIQDDEQPVIRRGRE
jgi:hypothetical protein